MFKDLRPYPEYHNPAGSWLAAAPAHWGQVRFRNVLRERDRRSVTGSEQLLRVSQYTGVTERRARGDQADTRASSLVGYKLVDTGDLAVNIMLAWNGSLGVSPCQGIVSPAYCVYRFRESVRPWYFHYLLRSPTYAARIKALSTGVVDSRLRLYTEGLYGLEALVPPADEQAAIVKYLAHAHRRIDRAIAAKRKLIALLDEQKQAIVATHLRQGEASVRGVRLKFVASLQTGLTLGKAYQDGSTGEYSYLRVANVQAGSLDLRQVTKVAVPPQEAARCTLRKGDVLMTEGGDIDKLGRATLWRGEIDACLHQNHIFAVRCGPDLDPDFLVLALSEGSARYYFAITSKKTTNLASTNSTTVRSFRFPCPPLHEQRAMAARITAETATADAAIDRARREIELLREFRTRLTSDVVTGQLDVRHIAATLPDLDPDDLAANVGGEGDDLDDEVAEITEDA